MSRIVDARRLPCPQPVILTRNAMKEADEVITLVSGRDQVGNVRRLAERAGWQVAVETREDGYALHLRRSDTSAVEPELTPDVETCPPATRRVVVIPSDTMGRGEPELGRILIKSFVYTLTQVEPLPQTIILFNTGVRLATQGSPVLSDLQVLAEKGVEILACGTCLDYFQLKDQLAVGTISNMYTIAETLLSAGHVVSL